jgi:ubiquinone/menaquinone biosynthesis C-methylase UbiE
MTAKTKAPAKVKTLPDTENDLAEVREHYQDYPYPFRDPEDEKQRLLQICGEYLGELNHWLYKGKKDFKSNFRVLIAGGGTGDCSTYMGEQLKNTKAEIVYLDFSKASMEIAKKRAEVRGIKNVEWVYDSLLNIPNLDLGKFDYINCSGVLHHLKSPPEGLAALASVLKPEGGIGMMVYAKYGRTGLYQVQEIMKRVNKGVTHRVEEVMNGKLVLNSLPATNWYMRAKELLGDHIHFGDIGLYDMFLHKQDRAYSIPELHEYITDAGLNFVEFSDITERLAMRPENYITDFSLLQKIKKMDVIEQQAICELIVGNIIKHSVYMSKAKNTIATFDDFNNVPYFYSITGVPKLIFDHLTANVVASGINLPLTLNSQLTGNVAVSLPIGDYTKIIFKSMMEDEARSLKEIFEVIRNETGTIASDAALKSALQLTLEPFMKSGVLLLRDKSISYNYS